jgi:hypothetical protein
MSAFAIWMTTFVKEYEDILISFLIKKGYSISAYSKDSEVTTSGSKSTFPVHIIALRAEKNLKTESHEEMHDKIAKLFFDSKRSFYSLIVQDLSGVSSVVWGPGRIFLPEEDKNKSTGSPFRDPPRDNPT